MARTKIDYGIDLGTTNSAISRMDNGEVRIIKAGGNDDTMPSCIAYNKKGMLAGKKAFAAYRSEQEERLSKDIMPNAFIEFKRTMGTDKRYYSSNAGTEFSSEELSSEVLKTLKSFVTDDSVNAVVITIPAAFKNNQKEATREAGKLAGFDHIELLQEPVAAAMAYGVNSKNKNGFWLVFDFGGGTFDAALLKVEEGIIKVIDTEGDNYLGGKNLDLAVVDQILLPHIQQNYTIDSVLANESSRTQYREALKAYAEEAKNELSFKQTYDLYKEDRCGIDDNGEEIEIDLTITQEEMQKVLSPIFQRAIDISLKLLQRNNLNGRDLSSLILVGGPTFSPVLRSMLEKQICKPDTSVDPMTVVSRGAALYASTIDLSETVKEQTRDRSKIQLEIGHEASTVELNEYVTLKILKDKTEGAIPAEVYAEVTRSDKAWSSGKVLINEIGEVVETQLIEGKTNAFEVTLYDGRGNLLESEPKSFTIIQGSKIGNATLAYNFGIEIKKRDTGKIAFETVKGLEKNKSFPATGTRNGLKTQKQIRPGMADDFIRIPLFEGGDGAENTRAFYNDHIADIRISGADLPRLLPENSDVDLTISIDRSEKITVTAYFPYLDFSHEVVVESKRTSIDTYFLKNELRKALGSIEELEGSSNSSTKLVDVKEKISALEEEFDNNPNDVDTKQKVLDKLREQLKVLDEIEGATAWPTLEAKLKEEFYRLEKAQKELGNEQTAKAVNELRRQLDEVLRAKDEKLGHTLLEEIEGLFVQLTLIYQLIGFVKQHNDNFGYYNWRNPQQARQILNEGMQIIASNPTVERLHPIIRRIFDLLPDDQRPSGDDSVLVG
jgi:heat shock protein hsp70